MYSIFQWKTAQHNFEIAQKEKKEAIKAKKKQKEIEKLL